MKIQRFIQRSKGGNEPDPPCPIEVAPPGAERSPDAGCLPVSKEKDHVPVKRLFDGGIASGAAARRLACVVSVGLVVLLVASPASAGLKIRPVFTGGPPPGKGKLFGGGNIEEIFKVAAESWEQVFKVGGGNWDVTIEFGWGPLAPGLNGQERFISQGGNNPVRMDAFSCHVCLDTRRGVLRRPDPARQHGVQKVLVLYQRGRPAEHRSRFHGGEGRCCRPYRSPDARPPRDWPLAGAR